MSEIATCCPSVFFSLFFSPCFFSPLSSLSAECPESALLSVQETLFSADAFPPIFVPRRKEKVRVEEKDNARSNPFKVILLQRKLLNSAERHTRVTQHSLQSGQSSRKKSGLNRFWSNHFLSVLGLGDILSGFLRPRTLYNNDLPRKASNVTSFGCPKPTGIPGLTNSWQLQAIRSSKW